MKYLITREQFLSKNTGSMMINEVLENEITWGGSLLGRLINSTIRRVKIGYNETKIDQVLVDLRNELDYLLSASITGDAEKKLHELVVKNYLQTIKDISLSTSEDDEKLKKLLGKSEDLYDPTNPKSGRVKVKGVMGKTLKELREELTGLDKIMGTDREKLLNLLSDFTDELRKLTYKDDNGAILPPGGNLSTTNYNRETTIQVLDDLKKYVTKRDLNNFNYKLLGYVNFLESIESENETTTSNSNKTASEENIDSGKKIVNVEKSSKNNLDLEKKISELIRLIQNNKSDLKKNLNVKKLINSILIDLKNKNLLSGQTNIDGEDINFVTYLNKLLKYLNSNESFIFENSTEIKKEAKSVKQIWNRFFSALDRKEPHRLTDREKKEFDEMISNPNDISKYYVYNPSDRPDPIISIARVFTNAYNLFATNRIPSGRPGGRVSTKTLREYIKLGEKKNLTVDEVGRVTPGEGPWAVKSIFDKYRDGVLKILQNQEYRKILANMKFVVPGSEDKFNESFIILEEVESGSKQPSSKKESHGQILLRFMNDMITPSKLGDFELLKNTYINDYFGVKLSNKEKSKYEAEETDKDIKPEDTTDNLVWQSKDPIINFKRNNDGEIMLFAFPSEYKEFTENILQKIKEPDSKVKILNKDLYKGDKILFLNRVRGVEDIQIGIESSIVKFYPIKLTFNKPILALKKKEDDNFNKIEPNLEKEPSKNSIHYGYLGFLSDSEIYLIHSSVAENGDKKNELNIYLQRLKIGKGILEDIIDGNQILVDGKTGKIYTTDSDFTDFGENKDSKENLNQALRETIESELKRILQ